MPELLVGRSLLRVLQDFVGFVDFLEARFRRGITLIVVGVVFLGQSAERRLHIFVAGATGQAKDLVVVTLGHE